MTPSLWQHQEKNILKNLNTLKHIVVLNENKSRVMVIMSCDKDQQQTDFGFLTVTFILAYLQYLGWMCLDLNETTCRGQSKTLWYLTLSIYDAQFCSRPYIEDHFRITFTRLRLW